MKIVARGLLWSLAATMFLTACNSDDADVSLAESTGGSQSGEGADPNGGSDGDADGDTGDDTAGGDSDSTLREVMFVGNNWDGTATIVDANALEVMRTGINLIPDVDQEFGDIVVNPVDLAFYQLIKFGPGEGNEQYVDDMFTTRDGRFLAVSRPSFADVIWVDIEKITNGAGADAIVREQDMDGQRTDHMGLSPDGRRLLVSDSTSSQVIEFSMVDERLDDGTEIKMGDRLRTFESGETPHESNYNAAGDTIYHASIGRVYLPGDRPDVLPEIIGPVRDALKGDRWFQIVDNDTFDVLARWDMGEELKESGYSGMSPAVRPMAVSNDERFIYFQVSYFHGLIEFDTQADDVNGQSDYELGGIPEPDFGAVRRLVTLPNRVPDMPREQFVNDSAHHGLSLNEAGDTLCVAGTIDDYAALLDRQTMAYSVFDAASTGNEYLKPYWTTEGPNGTCWVSLSGSDAVAVLDTKMHEELAYLDVGNHPQRVRLGYVPESVIAAWE